MAKGILIRPFGQGYLAIFESISVWGATPEQAENDLLELLEELGLSLSDITSEEVIQEKPMNTAAREFEEALRDLSGAFFDAYQADELTEGEKNWLHSQNDREPKK